jgi:hypothetical protein
MPWRIVLVVAAQRLHLHAGDNADARLLQIGRSAAPMISMRMQHFDEAIRPCRWRRESGQSRRIFIADVTYTSFCWG